MSELTKSTLSAIDPKKAAAAFFSQSGFLFQWTPRDTGSSIIPAITIIPPTLLAETASRETLRQAGLVSKEAANSDTRTTPEPITVAGENATEFLKLQIDNPLIKSLQDQLGMRTQRSTSPARFA